MSVFSLSQAWATIRFQSPSNTGRNEILLS